MHMTRKSRRWLPVRIDDFEKWQAGLLEESARRLSAAWLPAGVFTGGALSGRRSRSAASAHGCG